jgi:hypothetical protein
MEVATRGPIDDNPLMTMLAVNARMLFSNFFYRWFM